MRTKIMVLMAVHGVEPTPTSPGTTAHAGEKPVKASPHSADPGFE
ncbi:MAG: hypothetical protein VYE74_04470 [Verrucomicrobiota bacterium]|nr:hypothetical protein [Verrucomicrobiota bacterium]